MKDLNNLRPNNYRNEFITIYDDTYEILPNYTSLNAISVALTDFAAHVAAQDLSLFWVNYVAPDQAAMYVKDVFDGDLGKDRIILTTPTILIGWTKDTDKVHRKYYWLRLVDGRINVVVTSNIGDVMRVVSPCTTTGVHITTDSIDDADDVDFSDNDVLTIGTSIYFTVLSGLAKVIEVYTANSVGILFDKSLIETKNKETSITKWMLNDLNYPNVPSMGYPVVSDDLKENYYILATAMLHDFVKNNLNHTTRERIACFTDNVTSYDGGVTSIISVIIGTNTINGIDLFYMVNNIAGKVHVDIKRYNFDTATYINIISIPLSSTELYIDDEFETLVICAINDIVKS